MERYFREHEKEVENFRTQCVQDVYQLNRLSDQMDGSIFKVFHLNIRSVNKNLDELKIVLRQIDRSYDVIVLTETWQLMNPEIFSMPQYDLIYNSGEINQNDGVIVYIKSCIQYKFILEDVGGLKFIIFDILYQQKNIKLTAAYRPHTVSKDVFNDCLVSLFNKHKHDKDINIFLGDTNIDLLAYSIEHEHYMNILCEQGFVPTIDAVTRQKSGSCLDHIFLKTLGINEVRVTPIVLEIDLTDHYPVMLYVETEKSEQRPRLTKSKKYIDYTNLEMDLTNESWENIYSAPNVSEATGRFIETFTYLTDKNSRRIIKKNIKRKEWITEGIIKSINEKNSMYKKIKSEKFMDENLNEKYKRYKKHLEKLIKIAKINYYENEIQKHKNDPQQLWRVITDKKLNQQQISSIMQDNVTLTERTKIAETFNTYFTSIGTQLANEIKKKKTKFNNSESSNQLKLNFDPCDEQEILKVIESLKANKSPGIDGIQVTLLKRIAKSIVAPLRFLVNFSMRTGMFPVSLKTTLIKPIHKAGDKSSVNNYRPISLVSNISKIFERIIHNRVTKFLEGCKILSERQFGFRVGKSTQDAIAALTGEIYRCLDMSRPCLGVFVDLAKAFDTVSHDGLLDTLECMGVEGSPLNWFRSYLIGRKQCVQVGESISSLSDIHYGVPQGTILGPVLFNIYINSMFSLRTRGKLFAFADDTAVFYEGDSWEQLKSMVEMDFKDIIQFLNYRVLTINKQKTKFMLFSNSSTVLPEYRTLNVEDDFTIHSADHIKYLGVILDPYLRWNFQVDNVVKKIRKMIPRFRFFREFCNPQLLRTLYLVLVQPLLVYGLLGWGGVVKHYLLKLEVTQKWLLKIIYNKPYRYPSEKLFQESAVMNLRQLYMLVLAVHQFKNISSAEFNEHLHGTRHRGRMILIPRTMKTIGQRSHTFLSPRVYNYIPACIKASNSLKIFKLKLKTWIGNLSSQEVTNLLDIKNSYVHT